MAKKSIFAELITSDKGNKVWKVFVLGSKNKEDMGFCKTAVAALKFAYILKARTGCRISFKAQEQLRLEHALSK